MDNMDIIVLLFDQLGAKWLEKASELGYTPNIDKLKAHGTDFSRAYTSCAMCMPARASMLTGLHPRQHGVYYKGYTLSPEFPTYMSALKKRGYFTAGFGKFHISPEHDIDRPDFTKYGFDRYLCTEDVEKWCPGGFMMRANAQPIPGYFASVKDKADTQTAFITDKSVAFLEEAPTDSPVCMMVSYVEPHPPMLPPEEYLDRVDMDKLPRPLPPVWRDDPDAPRVMLENAASKHPYGRRDDWCVNDPDGFWMEARRYYFADVIHLDEEVGRLLDALDRRNGWKNTCIILTADHGEMLGDFHLTEKMAVHYDASLRIPMVVSMPGCDKKSCDALVQSEDVFFTVLDAAGCPDDWYIARPPMPIRQQRWYWEQEQCYAHTEAPPRLPGMPASILSFCRGEAVEGWREALSSDHYRTDHTPIEFWTRTVITDQYRYSYYPGRPHEQLFDLKNDPDELHNLVALPEYKDVVSQMRAHLIERSIWSEYPLSIRNMTTPGIS